MLIELPHGLDQVQEERDKSSAPALLEQNLEGMCGVERPLLLVRNNLLLLFNMSPQTHQPQGSLEGQKTLNRVQ